MASEIDIREAIRARIEAATSGFTPPPRVESRDVMGVLDGAAINDLRDSVKEIHAWIVTQRSMLPIDVRQGGAVYELIYELTQLVQYRSGSDASNSDRQASLERDAVTSAFRYVGELPEILKKAQAQPIEWPAGFINKPDPNLRGQVRRSTAIIRARNFYGPVACSS